MGYVAVKGGTQAVLNAEELVEYFRLKGGSEPVSVRQIQDQMRLAVDRAMSEGALYAPELAALALKQSEGDSLEASFLLRAYRSTVHRALSIVCLLREYVCACCATSQQPLKIFLVGSYLVLRVTIISDS